MKIGRTPGWIREKIQESFLKKFPLELLEEFEKEMERFPMEMLEKFPINLGEIPKDLLNKLSIELLKRWEFQKKKLLEEFSMESLKEFLSEEHLQKKLGEFLKMLLRFVPYLTRKVFDKTPGETLVKSSGKSLKKLLKKFLRISPEKAHWWIPQGVPRRSFRRNSRRISRKKNVKGTFEKKHPGFFDITLRKILEGSLQENSWWSFWRNSWRNLEDLSFWKNCWHFIGEISGEIIEGTSK